MISKKEGLIEETGAIDFAESVFEYLDHQPRDARVDVKGLRKFLFSRGHIEYSDRRAEDEKETTAKGLEGLLERVGYETDASGGEYIRTDKYIEVGEDRDNVLAAIKLGKLELENQKPVGLAYSTAKALKKARERRQNQLSEMFEFAMERDGEDSSESGKQSVDVNGIKITRTSEGRYYAMMRNGDGWKTVRIGELEGAYGEWFLATKAGREEQKAQEAFNKKIKAGVRRAVAEERSNARWEKVDKTMKEAGHRLLRFGKDYLGGKPITAEFGSGYLDNVERELDATESNIRMVDELPKFMQGIAIQLFPSKRKLAKKREELTAARERFDAEETERRQRANSKERRFIDDELVRRTQQLIFADGRSMIDMMADNARLGEIQRDYDESSKVYFPYSALVDLYEDISTRVGKCGLTGDEILKFMTDRGDKMFDGSANYRKFARRAGLVRAVALAMVAVVPLAGWVFSEGGRTTNNYLRELGAQRAYVAEQRENLENYSGGGGLRVGDLSFAQSGNALRRSVVRADSDDYYHPEKIRKACRTSDQSGGVSMLNNLVYSSEKGETSVFIGDEKEVADEPRPVILNISKGTQILMTPEIVEGSKNVLGKAREGFSLALDEVRVFERNGQTFYGIERASGGMGVDELTASMQYFEPSGLGSRELAVIADFGDFAGNMVFVPKMEALVEPKYPKGDMIIADGDEMLEVRVGAELGGQQSLTITEIP